jgi:drug/metabolite transporter (DMT)-like permease
MAGAICFSSKAIFVKLTYLSYPADAITILTLRMAFSLPFFVISAMVSTGRKSNVRFTTRQWFAVATVGVFGYYISSILDFKGLQYVSAGMERLILFIYPTFVLVISAFWKRKSIHKTEWIAVAITYAGLIVAFSGEAMFTPTGDHFYFGVSLILLCAITYALYIVASGSLIPVIGAMKFNSYAMSFAGIAVISHFGLFGQQSLFGLPLSVYLYCFLMAIVATVVPTYLISFSLKRLGANTTAVIASIGPVSTIIQAYFFLGEQITAFQIVGTVLVLIGIVVITRKTTKSPQASSLNTDPSAA